MFLTFLNQENVLSDIAVNISFYKLENNRMLQLSSSAIAV
jgi:hypothetical protein